MDKENTHITTAHYKKFTRKGVTVPCFFIQFEHQYSAEPAEKSNMFLDVTIFGWTSQGECP